MEDQPQSHVHFFFSLFLSLFFLSLNTYISTKKNMKEKREKQIERKRKKKEYTKLSSHFPCAVISSHNASIHEGKGKKRKENGYVSYIHIFQHVGVHIHIKYFPYIYISFIPVQPSNKNNNTATTPSTKIKKGERKTDAFSTPNQRKYVSGFGFWVLGGSNIDRTVGN